MNTLPGIPFTSDNQPIHDRSVAGRKGKAASPWRKGNMRSKGSVKLREEWRKELRT